MRVLLLALPNDHPYVRSRIYPTLGICSLAGNIDQAQVRCLDLIITKNPEQRLRSLIREFDPQLVGFSAMSFQYEKALELATRIKALKPAIQTVLGGYHATTGYELIATEPAGRRFDFLIRGEGEEAINQLVQALRCGDRRYDQIAGLSYWQGGEMIHNPRAPAPLDLSRIRLPARHKRLVNTFYSRKVRVDAMETSRGCTHHCSICSILQMYGRTYREYELDRVIEDALLVKSMGVQKIFVIDDNVTLNVPRFKRLLQRIIEERLNLEWIFQVSAAGIASDESLADLMGEAGVVHVFVGFEHMANERLGYYKSASKVEMNHQAVRYLKKNKISVFGAFLIGAPDDDRASIKRLVSQVRNLDIDLPLIMCLTPFLGTEVRKDLLARGLIVNESDFRTYDIDHVNIRTKHLSARELRQLQVLSMMRLYIDPTARTGRHVYKSLLGRAISLEEVAAVLPSFIRDLAQQLWPSAPRSNLVRHLTTQPTGVIAETPAVIPPIPCSPPPAGTTGEVMVCSS